MKTLQAQVYIQQWFYEEQGAKFICWWVTLLKRLLVQLILIGTKLVSN